MTIDVYEGKHGDEVVLVDDVEVTYTQVNDCTEDSGIIQRLILSTRNNGIARFIHVRTDGWSISSGDELTKIINDFENRAGLKTST